jgi:hypothetical protein
MGEAAIADGIEPAQTAPLAQMAPPPSPSTHVRSRPPCGLAALACIAGGLLSAAPAAALECPAPPATTAPALASVDAESRLRFLEWAFDREIREVDIWSWTWGSAYVAGSVAQGIIAGVIPDRGLRIDLTVGSIAAGFGALSLFGLPLRVTLLLRDARGAWSETDRCRLLAQAEATLVEAADRERLASSWVPHVGNVLLNAGIALILGLGYGRWTSAAISGGIGVAVGEANVLSQPHHLPGLLERYRAGRIDDASGALGSPFAFTGGVGRTGAVVAWTFHF